MSGIFFNRISNVLFRKLESSRYDVAGFNVMFLDEVVERQVAGPHLRLGQGERAGGRPWADMNIAIIVITVIIITLGRSTL